MGIDEPKISPESNSKNVAPRKSYLWNRSLATAALFSKRNFGSRGMWIVRSHVCCSPLVQRLLLTQDRIDLLRPPGRKSLVSSPQPSEGIYLVPPAGQTETSIW